MKFGLEQSSWWSQAVWLGAREVAQSCKVLQERSDRFQDKPLEFVAPAARNPRSLSARTRTVPGPLPQVVPIAASHQPLAFRVINQKRSMWKVQFTRGNVFKFSQITLRAERSICVSPHQVMWCLVSLSQPVLERMGHTTGAKTGPRLLHL